MQLSFLTVSALAVVVSCLTPSKEASQQLTLLGRKRRQQQAPADLQTSATRLAGVVDAVNRDYEELRSAAESVDSNCRSTLASSESQVQSHNTAISHLEHTSLQSTKTYGRLQAELAHLAASEQQAQESYDTTVAQRAHEAASYRAWNATNAEQEDVVSRVVAMLHEQRNGIVGLSTSTNLQPAATSSTAGLDQLIGVFSEMESNLEREAVEEKNRHDKSDADLLSLVNSHKTTLQHVDTQYEATHSQALEAQSSAQDAKAEKAVRQSIVDGEKSVSAVLSQLCGSGISQGAYLAASDRAWSNFKNHAGQATTLMEEIIASSELSTNASNSSANSSNVSNVSLLQLHISPDSAALRRAAMKSALAAGGLTDAHSASTGAGHLSRRTIRGASSTIGEPSSQAASIHLSAMTPRKALQAMKAEHDKTLAALAHKLQVQDSGAENAFLALFRSLEANETSSTTELTVAAENCVNQKQVLTSQIVSARQSARTAREQAHVAERNASSTAHLVTLVQAEENALTDAKNGVTSAWAELLRISQSGSFAKTMQDALDELAAIDSDIQSYLNSGEASPRAQPLPVMLSTVRTSVIALRDNGITSGTFYEFYGELQSRYTDELSDLESKEHHLAAQQTDASDRQTTFSNEASSHENSEQQLMLQRSALEAACEDV